MKVEDDFGKALGRMLFTILVKDIDFNRPFLHGTAFHLGGLVAACHVSIHPCPQPTAVNNARGDGVDSIAQSRGQK